MSSQLTQRRALLALFAGTALQASAQTAARDVFYGGGRYQVEPNAPAQFALSRIEPTGNAAARLAQTTFFPHGLALSPVDPARAFAFEKIGPGAAAFDLNTMTLVQTIPAVAGRRFYGHGVVSADGQTLYSTETSPDEKGAIGVRDAKTLVYLGDFPSYGAHPHDCHLIDDGNTLLVTNGGGASGAHGNDIPALCYIDVRSQKLLERVQMPDARFNTGHVQTVRPAHSSDAVVVSAPRKGLDKTYLGAVSVRRTATVSGAAGAQSPQLRVLADPLAVTQALLGEALSVQLIPERDLFAVTHPTPGLVTFWRLSSLQAVKQIALPSARGIVLSANRRSLWVSYGAQAWLIQINLADLTVVDSSRLTKTFITGSHLMRLDL